MVILRSKWRSKWLLAGLLLLSFAPASWGEAKRGCDYYRERNCRPTQRVPEGGSSAMYLAGAGLICAGAMLLRFGMRRSEVQ
jgi:hypothetical protein